MKFFLLLRRTHLCRRTTADLIGAMIAKSLTLADFVRTTVDAMQTGLFDAGLVAQCVPRDGVQLDAANTKAVGSALVARTRALRSERERS